MPCKKSKRMADGGILLADAGTKETPEQLLARMNAKYGLGDTGKPVAQTAPQPAPAPAPTPPAGQAPAASASGGMFGKVIDSVNRRNEELNRVSRYARGGIMPVIGAGSGTSDSVPAIVAGQKVRLSNGEGAAILPAKTMKNKAAVHAIEEIIEATNGKPTATSDEDDAGLACGGVKARKMAGGGILGEQDEDQNRGLIGPSVRGVVRNGSSFTQAPPEIPAATPVAQASPPGVDSVRPWWSGTDTRDERTGLEQERARSAAGMGVADTIRQLNGPSLLTSALVGDGKKPTTSSPVASTAQASYSNEGRPSAISAVNGLDSSPLASNTGNAGNASLAPPSVANPGAGNDAYGNSTAVTRQLQGELAKAQAENAKAQADYDARFGNRPTYEQQQQAEADRFNRFVRQSTADSMAHDLATGGGTARSNAGKIAALDAIQRGLNSENDTSAAQKIAAMRARSGIAETRMLGDNRLAEAALQGQNNLAVENFRQGSPSTALLARKMQGEIADADAVRAVRNEIADSAASGNQTAYNNAVKKGIAFGIIKNERPANEFAFAPSSLGGGHVIDKATGSLMHIDAEGKATPVQMPGQQKKPTASKDAIEFLKKNPDLAGKFDEMYGPGEAKKILGK